MSVSTVKVSFTDINLTIIPEECSMEHVDSLIYGKPISLKEFSKGCPTTVEMVLDTKQYIFRSSDRFVLGREIE